MFGHKYPFNSCEILCSDNGLNINKLLTKPLSKQLKKKEIEKKNEQDKKIEDNKEEKGNKKEVKEKEKEKEIIKEKKIQENINNESQKIENKENEDISTKKEDKGSDERDKDKNEKDNLKIKESNSEDEKIKGIKEELNNEKKETKEAKTEEKEKNDERKKEEEIKEEKEEIKEEKEDIKKEKVEIKEEKEEVKEEKEEVKEEKEKVKEENEENFCNFISSINDDSEEDEKELEKQNEEDVIDEKENEKIINDELLNPLFSYIDNKSFAKNPVISGYFNKITNFLLKRNTKIILDYFFIQKESILKKLLSSVDEASIRNIVENILYALFENIIPNSDKYFYEIIGFLLDLISKKESSDETVEGVCQLIINTIIFNNKLKFASFIESSFIQKIKDQIKKLYENKKINSKKILLIIEFVTKINNNILVNLEKRITPNLNFDSGKIEIINIIKINDRNSYQFYTYNDNKTNSEFIMSKYKLYLENICTALNDISLFVINDILSDNTIGKDNKKFGLNNIYKFEFICSVIDLYINSLQYGVDQRIFITEKINELIKTKIFKEINNLYFIYKNNNMYSNTYSQIIQIIVNDQSPKELIRNILLSEDNKQENNLINLLINDIINNLKYIYEDSKNEMYSLAFSHEIYILNSIFSSNNSYIKEIIDKDANSKFFYEMLVENTMKQFNKKLYKINDKIEQKKVDLLNPTFDAQKEQSDTNIPFSLQTFKEIVSLFLLVYEKYIKNEDYKIILKENQELLDVSIYFIINIF